MFFLIHVALQAMPGKTKVCLYCGEAKPLSDFGPIAKAQNDTDGTGKVNRCNSCVTNRRMYKNSQDPVYFLRDLYSKHKSATVKKAKHEWTITVEDVIACWDFQKGRCALSGVYMTHHHDRGERKEFNASIDRIRSTEGYTIDNIQLVCARVNIIKNNLDEASLYWWVKNIYDFSCD